MELIFGKWTFFTMLFPKVLPNRIILQIQFLVTLLFTTQSGFHCIKRLMMAILLGLSCRVCDVLELLQRSEIWGGTRLHVSPPTVQNSLQDVKLPIWLHVWLDSSEANRQSSCPCDHECCGNRSTTNSATTDHQYPAQTKSRTLVSGIYFISAGSIGRVKGVQAPLWNFNVTFAKNELILTA